MERSSSAQRRLPQQLPALAQRSGFVPVGEETEMPPPLQAVGEAVQEKAPDG
jgi:hypothetical protein